MSVSMKKIALCIVYINLFGIVRAQTPPASFVPEKNAPDFNNVLADPIYTDGWSKLSTDLASQKYNIAIADNRYISGQEITRTNLSMGNYITAGNNNYVVNNTINAVQVNLGSGSYAIGNKLQGDANAFGSNAKGVLRLNSGAQAYDTTINNLGTMSVYKGAEAYNTTINTGGNLTVADGYVQSTIVDGGRFDLSLSSTNSLAKDTIIINGGEQNVWGGIAQNTHIGNGGYQLASSKAIDTYIYDGGFQHVYAGSPSAPLADENAIIYAGGQQRIQSGESSNATVYGTQTISGKDGRWENGQWVEETGARYNYSPTASNATIKQGGVQSIDTSGQAIGTTVEAGGKQYVYETGVIKNTTVDGGYSLLKDGATSKGDLTISNSGILAIESTASQIANIENATLDSTSQMVLETNSQLTGDSFVNIANLANNGQVSFGSASVANVNYMTLNVDKLSGNGQYTMRADIANQQGDLLNVKELGTASNNKLVIVNQGSATAKPTDTLTVVKTESGGSASQFTLSHKVEQGGYLYDLRQNGNNWELFHTPGGQSGGKTSTALAAGNFLNISYLMGYIDTQNLMQRMGDLRNTPSTKDVDFWIRGFAGKLDSFSNNLGGFDMTYRGTQMGVDKLSVLSTGSFRAGVAAGYTDADPNYKNGHGSAKSYHFGLYGTYVDNSGIYVDTLLKYQHIKNRFNVKDTQNNSVTGKANSNGYGLSIETGKRFYLQADQGLYLEPQMQLSYTHQAGDTVHSSNGLKVKLSDYDSVLGRASVVFGYEIKQTANPINVYLKTGYVREFAGNDINYYLNNNKEKHNFKGNFWDNELGVSTTINQRHTLHADLSYANGNRFDKQQINVGYRYAF